MQGKILLFFFFVKLKWQKRKKRVFVTWNKVCSKARIKGVLHITFMLLYIYYSGKIRYRNFHRARLEISGKLQKANEFLFNSRIFYIKWQYSLLSGFHRLLHFPPKSCLKGEKSLKTDYPKIIFQNNVKFRFLSRVFSFSRNTFDSVRNGTTSRL